MADYLTQMSQAIAAARPRLTGGGGGRGGTFQVGTHREGPEVGLGKSLGRVFEGPLSESVGKWLSRSLDTKTVIEEAEQARTLVMGMPDEMKKALTIRPDVQEKRKELVKHAPHLFVDASQVWGEEDKAFKGKWEYAPTVPSEEERIKRAERKKPVKETQLYRGREAKVGSEEAARKINERTARIGALLEEGDVEKAKIELEGMKEDLRIKKEEAPLKKESLEVQVARLREEITSLKSGRKLAEERQPYELDFLKAHTQQVRKLGASYDLKSQADIDQARAVDQRKDLDATYNEHFAAIKDTRKKHELIGTILPHKYAEEVLTHTQTLTNALGTMDFSVQNKEGQLVSVSLPTPLMSTQGALAVNQGLNEAYTAFMQQYKSGAADPEVLKSLYSQAEKLHDSTFGFINKDTIQYIPPGIQMPAENIRWKMLEMQYISVFELGKRPEDPEELAAWEVDKAAMAKVLGTIPEQKPEGFLWNLIRPWSWNIWKSEEYQGEEIY